MIHFTKYADKKFDILNKHKVFFTREIIEDVVNLPDKTKKKGKYQTALKDDIKVVFKQENGITRILTFFPIKTKA